MDAPRIAKFAFDYATREGRGKVTAIHKANIMKLGDGLFLRSCQEIAELYPHIKVLKPALQRNPMSLLLYDAPPTSSRR